MSKLANKASIYAMLLALSQMYGEDDGKKVKVTVEIT